MNWNININQKAIIELNNNSKIKLDLKDATILGWLFQFKSANKTQKIKVNGTQYFWTSYSHIINENPLLKINNKNTMRTRFDKLRDAGLINRYIDKLQGNKTFTCFTEIGLKLFENKNLSTQKLKPIYSKVETLSTQKLNNNNIKDNNINNNIHIQNVCVSDFNLLMNSLSSYFSKTTTQQQNKVLKFLNTFNELQYNEFKKQFEYYKKYKKLSNEKIHRFENFCKEWNECNWEQLHNNLKKKTQPEILHPALKRIGG